MLVVGAATSGPKNGTTTPAAPASSVPKSPIPFTKGAPFTLNSPESEYWVFVPNSYDGCRRRQGGDLLGTERRSGEGAGDDR
jgi:hypothetical protein